ncbi:MAG TPA: phage holin family protein, partial [Gaiellaceae bacterium]
AGMLGGAAVAALLALGSLTAFLIMALAIVLPEWAAALLVTALWGATAAVLALRGKDKLGEVGAPVPEKTVDSVKEDVQWLKGQTRSAAS